jgi:protein-tyrosine phosphatase
MMQILLFVCTGNYYRSRFAEELFNARRPDNLAWTADSRGFELWSGNPGPIAQATRRRLENLGIALREPVRMPRTLTAQDIAAATRLIALDEAEHKPYVARLFPTWSSRFEYWSVADLHLRDAKGALDEIESQVDRLLASLRAS